MSDTKTLHEKLYDLQSEVGAIAKDSKNPFYKSKYFDVNGLLNHLQPLLKKHRLLLIQPIEEGYVRSVIIDVDGDKSVTSEMQLPTINDPQKMGSAITYFRRYTLQSLLALQAEDDDGNTASKASKSELTPKSKKWDSVVEKLATGSDLTVVEKHFHLTKENRDRLMAEVQQKVNPNREEE